MKTVFRQFMAPLTPGVRAILYVLTAMYALTLVGVLSHLWDLYSWLGLQGPSFWHGKLWTIATYALVPATVLDALFNWIVVLVLGTWLERVWSRRQLWLSCLISTLGAGIVYAVVRSSSPGILAGTAPAVFGLLAAWGWLCGHERVLFWFIWEMSVRQAAIAMTILAWLTMALACVGPVNATIMLCGGIAGLFHIWVQQRFLHARGSQAVASERIGRLEL